MSKQLLTLAIQLMALPVFAQIDSSAINTLNEVVVTATRSNMKQSQTGKIVTVLNQKLIEQHAAQTISDLLNTQAGFFINGSNNAPGTNLDVYFRGAGIGKMLVVIDGIPVFDPSLINNSFDLNSIMLDQVEKIEILKGGQSTLWGSDAVAGVIQIFLKKGNTNQPHINTSVSYGSFQTFQGNLGLNGKSKNIGYQIQYTYKNSLGFPSAFDSTGNQNFKNDGFEQHNVQTSFDIAISKPVSIRLFNNWNRYQNDLPGGPFTDEKDFTAKNTNTISGFTLLYKRKGIQWNLTGSHMETTRSFINDSSFISSPYTNYSNEKYWGATSTIETYGNIKFTKHLELVGGIQYMHQQTDQYYSSSGIYGPYQFSLSKEYAKINQRSVYASLLVTELHHVNVEVGGRINHHSIYGSNATFSLNPSIMMTPHSKLFFNLSSAYKIPSLYQLYSDYGNKSLQPETTLTYEIGFETHRSDNKIAFRVAAFKRDSKNMIIFFTDPTSPFFYSYYKNRDAQHDYGMEIESSIQINANTSWNINASYINGEGIEDNVKVKNLYRRPQFSLNSAINLQLTKRLSIIPSVRYIGSRLKGPYDEGPAKQPAYYTIDLMSSYQIKKQFSLFFDCRNITNQQYFDIVGYNSKRLNVNTGIRVQL